MPLRYILEAILAYSLIGLIRLLGLERGGSFMAFLAGFFGPMSRVNYVARDNLNRAYPEKPSTEIDLLTKQVWENAGRTFGELVNLDKLLNEQETRLKITGAQKAKEIAAQGRGLILFSAHMGNWETMSMAIRLSGLDATGVYRHANNPILNRWMIKKRLNNVISHQVPKGSQGAKELIKRLKQGASICMLVDQKMNDGIEAQFFGRRAMTPSAAASMARRYNVPLMLITNKRIGNCQFEVEFHDAFEVDKTDDAAADILATTQKLNDQLEAAINENPGQWLWLHKRWKKRDDDPLAETTFNAL